MHNKWKFWVCENDIQTMELSHWESEHFSDDSDELNVELPEFDIHF